MQPNSEKFTHSRRSFLKTSALAAGGVLVFGCVSKQDQSLIEILHLPKQFSRRADELSANVSGRYASNLEQLRYQVNGGDWITFSPKGPRVPEPLFTLEMKAEDLKVGANELIIEATPKRGEPEITTLSFDYVADPVALPMTIDWSEVDAQQLDVQDGLWDTFSTDSGWRVRPKPGYEDYDRLLNITGAFPGGRRIETDLTLRSNDEEDLYGLGVLPMWGGHPDDEGMRPRRGWIFGIAWFYSYYKGVGAEFSYKPGKEKPDWVSAYRNYNRDIDKTYRLISECFPEVDEAGNHLRYRLRMKWFVDGEAEPDDWVEVADSEGAPVPEGEYSVALLAHRCQVEFGPVKVTAVDAVQV